MTLMLVDNLGENAQIYIANMLSMGFAAELF
jgi:hypothetical protein